MKKIIFNLVCLFSLLRASIQYEKINFSQHYIQMWSRYVSPAYLEQTVIQFIKLKLPNAAIALDTEIFVSQSAFFKFLSSEQFNEIMEYDFNQLNDEDKIKCKLYLDFLQKIAHIYGDFFDIVFNENK
jgi:hypothetical protein